LSGINREECVAPIPGRPCLTGLLYIHHVSTQIIDPQQPPTPPPMPQSRRDLLRNTKLPQIKSHHLRLDLHLIELLTRIDPNHAADHLGHHDHVPQVRLDQLGFLVGLGFLFCFAQFFDQAHGFALEAPVEAAAGARVNDVAELFRGEVEESVVLVRRVRVDGMEGVEIGGWEGDCRGE